MENMSKKKTHEEFLNEIFNIHGNSITPIDCYVNAITKLNFKCNHCTNTWATTPNNLISRKSGCPKCKTIKVSDFHKHKYEYIESFFKKEGCQLLSENYLNSNSKLKYICTCRNISMITFNNFKNGQRCGNCKGDRTSKTQRKHISELALELQSYDCNLIEQETDYINSESKITYFCKCGKKISKIRNTAKKSPYCSDCTTQITSKGEKKVSEALNKLRVTYLKQVKEERCFNVLFLRFDFCVKDKIFLEFDGQQHFKPVDFGGKGKEWADAHLEENKKRDKIKNQYCIDNRIPLIRIPYWEQKI